MNKEIQNQSFWSYDEQTIFEQLETTKKGLTEDESTARQKIFGPNLLPEEKNVYWKILLRQFTSPLIFILLFAGLVTFILKEFGDTIIIALTIVVNAGLGFYQENKAETAIRHLKSYLEQRTRVIRNGQEIEISVEEIVPGDVIKIISGTRIAADSRILSCVNLTIDESMLTGESLPIEKNKEILPTTTSLTNRTNCLYAGSLVTQGNGLAVVTAIGSQTELGKIAFLLDKGTETSTPLQKSISYLAWILTVVILIIVILIFVIGLWRGEPTLNMFLTTVAIAVGAIPEGLPITLTVVLSVGVERLAKKKAIVRKLVAAETLGSTTLILTDKTGTLTKAKMSLAHIISLKNLLTNSIPKERLSSKPLTKEEKEIISLALVNCDVTPTNGKEKQRNGTFFSGKPLEVSLASEAHKRGFDIFSFKEPLSAAIVSPFNSQNKYSAYLITNPSLGLDFLPWGDSAAFLVYFGAPEVLIENSFLAEEEKKIITQRVEEFAKQGERVLAVAYKPLKKDQLKNDWLNQKLNNLNLAGLISFYDPPRPDVKKTLHQIEKLGIKIVIATGDHPGTAIALAKEIGLKVKESQMIEGNSLRSLGDNELMNIIDSIKIFARVTPEDKLRITTIYQKKKEVIAMTGDGINDAPAIK
ncbi:MAG: cation-transporting P-type ATPase, partial [Candidatus Paceibacterota bacterium]